jgi:hypothetical protein
MGDYLNRVSALGMVGRGVLAVNECSQTKETASMELFIWLEAFLTLTSNSPPYVF